MFLFLRLVLAHFIGDFPLQVDEISRKKREGASGHLLHGLVVGLTYFVCALPFLHHGSLLLLIVSFTLFHVLLDWLKSKVDRNNPPNFWLFCLDQGLHVGILSVVLFFDYSWNVPAVSDTLWGEWYGSDRIVMMAIGYLVSTFAGTYVLYSFTNTFFTRLRPATVPRSLNYGLLERGWVMTLFCFFAPVWYPLVIVPFFARLIRPQEHRVYQWLLNSVFAAGIGLVLRVLVA